MYVNCTVMQVLEDTDTTLYVHAGNNSLNGGWDGFMNRGNLCELHSISVLLLYEYSLTNSELCMCMCVFGWKVQRNCGLISSAHNYNIDR